VKGDRRRGDCVVHRGPKKDLYEIAGKKEKGEEGE
jgi:hypothetical protein